jgi:hypothetical protein
MTFDDMLQAVETLSPDELERLYQRIGRIRLNTLIDNSFVPPEFGDRDNLPLDIEELKEISAALREGFTEQDLEELEWAMNVEYIEPLDDIWDEDQ